MKDRAIVLLSSGLDSTVNLFAAHSKHDVVLALTFDYGQKAAVKEIESASNLTKHLKIQHEIIKLDFFKNFGQSSLLDQSKKVPTGNEVNIESMTQSQQTAKSVWVPNRNGIFLNIAAGFAEALSAKIVVPGFNIEEAATFPDNSQGFMSALTHSFAFSTANHVQTECYTIDLDKTQIVQMAIKLNIPLEKIWPCYFAKEHWCGECESCLRFARALKNNHLDTQKYFGKNL